MDNFLSHLSNVSLLDNVTWGKVYSLEALQQKSLQGNKNIPYMT